MIFKTFIICAALTASGIGISSAETEPVAKEAARTKTVQTFQAKNSKVFSVFVKGFCCSS